MTFFVQGAHDTETTDRIYKVTSEYVSGDLGVELSDRRVYLVYGKRDGTLFEARVGEPFERYCEPVIAIFYVEERDLYFVCTPNRGSMRGVPYVFEGSEVIFVADFEPDRA
jgi:hypothetical protein